MSPPCVLRKGMAWRGPFAVALTPDEERYLKALLAAWPGSAERWTLAAESLSLTLFVLGLGVAPTKNSFKLVSNGWLFDDFPAERAA